MPMSNSQYRRLYVCVTDQPALSTVFMLIYLMLYNRGTSKTQQDDAAGSSQDDEQPGPSRRKRQPSMSETMPLYMLCKEDLESMDKEVPLTLCWLFCSHKTFRECESFRQDSDRLDKTAAWC